MVWPPNKRMHDEARRSCRWVSKVSLSSLSRASQELIRGVLRTIEATPA
jgi:hypothetical protein